MADLTRLARSFCFTGTTSDLTGTGAHVSRTMVEGSAATGTWASQAIGGTATKFASFFTLAAMPGANGANSALMVNITVTTGNTNLRYSAQAHRVNSTGVVQTSSAATAETASGAAGRYWFDVTTSGLGTWASGDRLRIDIIARNTSGSANQSFTMQCYNTSTTTDIVVSGVLAFGWTGATGSWAYGAASNGLTWTNSNRTVQRGASQAGSDPQTDVLSTAVVRVGETGYGEIEFDHIVNTANTSLGIAIRTLDLQTYLGYDVGKTMGVYASDAAVWYNSALSVDTGSTYSDGMVVCVAVRRDVSPPRAWFRRLGGSWNATSGTANDPSTNVGGVDISWIGTEPLFLVASLAGSDVDNTERTIVNTGAFAFAYTQPSGIRKWDGSDVVAAANVTGAQATLATTQSATAGAVVGVTGAQTTDATTQSATAAVTPLAANVSGAQTTSATTQSATATLTPLAANVSGSQTTSAPGLSATATVLVTVTGAQTLPLSQSATATVLVKVTGAQTLPVVGQSATVGVVTKVTGNQFTFPVDSTGTVGVVAKVTGAQTTQAATQSATATAPPPLSVTGAQTTQKCTQSATVSLGAPFITVNGAQTLQAANTNATAGVVAKVTGAQTTFAVNSTGTIKAIATVTGAQSTPAAVNDARVTVRILVTGAQTLAPVITAGTIEAAVAVSNVWVNHGGTWKRATVFVKSGGTWKPATSVFVKSAGTWKQAA